MRATALFRFLVFLTAFVLVMGSPWPTAAAEAHELEWIDFTEHWSITRISDWGIRSAPRSIMESLFSPSEGDSKMNTLYLGTMLEPLDKQFISTEDDTVLCGGVPYEITSYFSPDLKVDEKELESVLGQNAPKNESGYLDFASRPLEKGEFVCLTLEEYAHFYLVEQTLLRTGTANRVDDAGNVTEQGVSITDEPVDVANALIAIGVHPGARMDYYQLTDLEDLQKVMDDASSEVPFFQVEAEYFMYQDGAYRAFSVSDRAIGKSTVEIVPTSELETAP